MTEIVIDPWALVYKGQHVDPELYIADLLSLYEQIETTRLPVRISAAASEVLSVDGVYPLAEELPAPLWPNRSDILRIVGALLDRLPKLEDEGIVAVLFEEFLAQPPLEPCTSDLHRAHIQDLACIVTILQERSGHRRFAILSRMSPTAGDTMVSLTLQDAEQTLEPPCRIGRYEGIFVLGPSLIAIYAAIDAASFASRYSLVDAIHISIWQQSGQHGCPFKGAICEVGDNFVATATSLNVLNNPARLSALIRACTYIALDIGLQRTHEIRTGRGAECPQVTRKGDGARAWRADIDRELHLHYWKARDRIEFAKVAMHADTSIPE